MQWPRGWDGVPGEVGRLKQNYNIEGTKCNESQHQVNIGAQFECI